MVISGLANGNRSQVQGSTFRVKDKEGIKAPKSPLNFSFFQIIANLAHVHSNRHIPFLSIHASDSLLLMFLCSLVLGIGEIYAARREAEHGAAS